MAPHRPVETAIISRRWVSKNSEYIERRDRIREGSGSGASMIRTHMTTYGRRTGSGAVAILRIPDLDLCLPAVVALNEWITPSLSSFILFGTLTDVILAAHMPCAAPCS
jgi:hypothetical protein